MRMVCLRKTVAAMHRIDQLYINPTSRHRKIVTITAAAGVHRIAQWLLDARVRGASSLDEKVCN
jgi:hypothetical protein